MEPGRPIYLKCTRAHRDDDLLETMNMNNWHEFLNSLNMALNLNDYGGANRWVANIGENLRTCLRTYTVFFDYIAADSYGDVSNGLLENIHRVLKFLGLQAREVRKKMRGILYTDFYFMCTEMFIQTGATPIKNIKLPLPII